MMGSEISQLTSGLIVKYFLAGSSLFQEKFFRMQNDRKSCLRSRFLKREAGIPKSSSENSFRDNYQESKEWRRWAQNKLRRIWHFHAEHVYYFQLSKWIYKLSKNVYSTISSPQILANMKSVSRSENVSFETNSSVEDGPELVLVRQVEQQRRHHQSHRKHAEELAPIGDDSRGNFLRQFSRIGFFQLEFQHGFQLFWLWLAWPSDDPTQRQRRFKEMIKNWAYWRRIEAWSPIPSLLERAWCLSDLDMPCTRRYEIFIF